MKTFLSRDAFDILHNLSIEEIMELQKGRVFPKFVNLINCLLKRRMTYNSNTPPQNKSN